MTNKVDADATLAKLRQQWEQNERLQYEQWFNSHMAGMERTGREMRATFDRWAQEDAARATKGTTATAPLFVSNAEAKQLRDMHREVTEQLKTIANQKRPKRIRTASGRVYEVNEEGDEVVMVKDRDKRASEQAFDRALAALDATQRELAEIEAAEKQAEQPAQQTADDKEAEQEQERLRQVRELL
jgi:hypothetical protein